MKNLLLCLLLFSTVCGAKTYTKQERVDNCKRIGEFAESAMTSRQNGVPVLREIKIIDDVYKKLKNKETHDLMTSITLDAYSKPSYMTEEYQKKAINDFSALYFTECMKLIK